jgi:3-methylcrotonyl-CoA carboxylase alpha subunit
VPPTVRPLGNGVYRVGNNPARTAWAVATANTRWVFLDGNVYEIENTNRGGRPRVRSHGGSLSAPMPATVRKINVAPGDAVTAGDVLIVLEAMKMELPVRALSGGIVTAVQCSEGELVQPGLPLVTIKDS